MGQLGTPHRVASWGEGRRLVGFSLPESALPPSANEPAQLLGAQCWCQILWVDTRAPSRDGIRPEGLTP